MNPFNYGAASMAAMESEGAEDVKRKKKAKALRCNRVDDTCLQTQCIHRVEHKWQPDCKLKSCSRDQRTRCVDCKIVKEAQDAS
jgi:hypothetical protein